MSNDKVMASEKALIEFGMPIASKIAEVSEKTKTLFSSSCVFRVPKELRQLNESAYVPSLIAIGPLHRKDEHLQTPMQHMKMRYTDILLYRLAKEDNGEISDVKKREVLLNCVEEMKKCVVRAKQCYAEEVLLVEKEMVEMMLVDGCFILNLLYSSYLWKKKNIPPGGDGSQSKPTYGGEDGSKSSGNHGRMVDPILDCTINESIVKRDLLLLENQIPLFILEKLFELTLKKIPLDLITGGRSPSLTNLIFDYFQDIMSPDGDNSEGKNDELSSNLRSDCVLWVNENRYRHILHFLHQNYRRLDIHENHDPNGDFGVHETGPKPTLKKLTDVHIFASDLDKAGVKFVPSKGNLFDVKFVEPKWPFSFLSARFQIPTLDIHDPTETIFRNLVALEQCCPEVDLYFTAYAKFIDMLIGSEEDVKVLTKAKVIRNHLGAHVDTSDLVNKLCKHIVTPKDFYHNNHCEAAFKYSQRSWPEFKAYWIRLFSGSPWSVIGFVLGIITSFITVFQFFMDFLK